MAQKSEKFCPLIAFHQFLGGKYKLRVLWDLRDGALRYGELKNSLVINNKGQSITARALSRELKELTELRLITRKEFPTVPPKVEYSLTERGQRVVPLLKEVANWGFHEIKTGGWFPNNK